MRLPVLLKRKIASLIKTMIPTPVGAVPSRLRQRRLQDRSLSSDLYRQHSHQQSMEGG